jgi:hypothetical protein
MWKIFYQAANEKGTALRKSGYRWRFTATGIKAGEHHNPYVKQRLILPQVLV